MKYKVKLTFSAEEDLFEIYQYIFLNDSPENAEQIFSKLQEKCLSLQKYPFRGHIPAELSFIGIDDFLEIIYNPYRIIYQVIEDVIFIHCILDGRRDTQKLLSERLLRE